MSVSPRLIVNCGASNVTAAVISAKGGSLRLDKLVTRDLEYDYSHDDAWLEAMTDALREISSHGKLSGPATLILPGSQLLTKTIKVPVVEAAKRAQVIAYEAQQSIPYGLHEVVWDSQVIGDDGVETDVLFIACKSDAISAFCRSVASTGFNATSIGAATVLDYNALQASHPSPDEDVLLINIGARSTNLLFSGSDGFYIRNIALGGNSLTQSIADSIGKRFTRAEEIKLAYFARHDVNGEDDTASVKALTDSAEAFMRRMGQEITRSIVNYRRQKKGAAPKKILLTGRGSLLPGLSEHLAKTQKVEVDYFDPLQDVEIDGSIAEDLNIVRLQIGEIIGEAVRDQIADSAGVNLLPETIQRDLAFKKKMPFLLVAAVCLAIAPFPVWMAKKAQASAYQEQLSEVQSFVAPAQAKRNEIADLSARAGQLRDAILRVEGIVNSKTNWIQFFAELQNSLVTAGDVWIDQLNVSRQKVETETRYMVILKGKMLIRKSPDLPIESLDRDAILARVNGLRRSLEGSVFIASSEEPVLDWSMLMQDGLNVLPFTINLVVAPAKPL